MPSLSEVNYLLQLLVHLAVLPWRRILANDDYQDSIDVNHS